MSERANIYWKISISWLCHNIGNIAKQLTQHQHHTSQKKEKKTLIGNILIYLSIYRLSIWLLRNVCLPACLFSFLFFFALWYTNTHDTHHSRNTQPVRALPMTAFRRWCQQNNNNSNNHNKKSTHSAFFDYMLCYTKLVLVIRPRVYTSIRFRASIHSHLLFVNT